MGNTKNTKTLVINRNVLTPAEFRNKMDFASVNNFDRDKFHSLEISGMILENRNLSSGEFLYGKFSDLSFVGVSLERSKFNFSECSNVVFKNCMLENAEFDFCKFDHVQFINCILNYSSFKFATGNVTFENCSMERCETHSASLETVFATCNLNGAEFNYCSSLKMDASSSIFAEAEFKNSTITGKMEQCHLDNCNCQGLDASGLQFSGCTMLDLSTEGAKGLDIRFDDEEAF